MTDSLKTLIARAEAEAFLAPTKPHPYKKWQPAVEAETAERFGVTWEQVVGQHRRADIVKARHYALVALSFLTECGDSELARMVGIDRCRIIFARKKLTSYFTYYESDRREFGQYLNAIRERTPHPDTKEEPQTT